MVTVTRQQMQETVTQGGGTKSVTVEQDHALTDKERESLGMITNDEEITEEILSSQSQSVLEVSKVNKVSAEKPETAEDSRVVTEESSRIDVSFNCSPPWWWFGDESRQQVDIRPSREGLSESCASKLEELRNAGMECNVLSGTFDHWAVANRDLETDDSEDGKISLQLLLRKKEVLRAEWAVVRRMYYCIDVHLKNAAAYQQFFHDVDEINSQLNALSKKMEQSVTSDPEVVVDPKTAAASLKGIQDILAEVQLLNVAIQEISERSSTVVPVRLRIDPLKEPLPVRSLCSFKNGPLSVIEGEPMFLLDNQGQHMWKVRNSTGSESEVPAVMVLIPPPDSEATEMASNLQGLLKETWAKHDKSLKETIARLLKILLKNILDKESLMRIISSGHLDEMLSALETSDGILARLFREYGDLLVMLNGVQTHVQNSTDEGDEAEGFDEIFTNVGHILELLLFYQMLQGRFEDSTQGNSSHESEWDTLDDAQQVEDEGMEVNVKKETESATVEGFTHSRQEMKQTFSIRGVIDPTNQLEISMMDAVAKGIIDQENGLYVNSVTGESMPIPEAMNQGSIIVELTQTMKSREKTTSVGLVSITISHETRPYTIRQVRDPRSDAILSINEAMEQGIFDKERNIFRNPDNNEEMSVENAIETGDLIVEYDEEAEKTEPEVVTKHFAITNVRDPETGRRAKFHEAVEKGIINKESGVYTDITTGDEMSLSEALRRGLVRARILTDPEQFETMLRERRLSNASTLSTDTRQSAA